MNVREGSRQRRRVLLASSDLLICRMLAAGVSASLAAAVMERAKKLQCRRTVVDRDKVCREHDGYHA
jgi:hypothetical protein